MFTPAAFESTKKHPGSYSSPFLFIKDFVCVVVPIACFSKNRIFISSPYPQSTSPLPCTILYYARGSVFMLDTGSKFGVSGVRGVGISEIPFNLSMRQRSIPPSLFPGFYCFRRSFVCRRQKHVVCVVFDGATLSPLSAFCVRWHQGNRLNAPKK